MSDPTTPERPRIDGTDVLVVVPVLTAGPDGSPPPADPDAADTWFTATFDAPPAGAGEEVVLRFGGLATLVDVDLNGERILESRSMYASHEVDVGSHLRGENELVFRCHALAPELARSRRPRARWRTRVVRDNGLRWIRTTILGRAPGFAPGPPVVGPWRPVWLERRRQLAVDALDLRPRLDGDDGILDVRATLRAVGGARGGEAAIRTVAVHLDGPSGSHRATGTLHAGPTGTELAATVRIPSVARWWPHTHGTPALHGVTLTVDIDGVEGPVEVDAGRVGFRTLAAGPTPAHDLERDGLDLHVNGVRLFARGAVWTPLPAAGSGDLPADDLERTLAAVVAGGMNMLRLPGLGAYETAAFHDRCDELGILVWQDLAFANLDYPFADPEFLDTCRSEVAGLLARIAGRPSLAVLCGNSEVEQQVAMLGLAPDLWRDPFYGETVPALARDAGCDAIVVPSAPFGGDRPFDPDHGVANYYGVGGYRRPLSDARLADVRFAAECLAFANVPDDAAIERLQLGATGEVVVHHPAWKAAVPRDNGSGWDFEDVRDHYLRERFGVEPAELRRLDHERYLDLSRAVSGEVMAEVFGMWRRDGSPTGGGLVLWLRDLVPGAGWGVLDDRGAPKVAYHHLRRAFAPVAVWTTDEGLGGVAVHVANDRPIGLDARVRVALYREGGIPVGEGSAAVTVPAHGATTLDLETVIGHFVDAAWAYRFGPPGHDVIVAALEGDTPDGVTTLARSFRYPATRPATVIPADRLGLEGCGRLAADGTASVEIRSRSVADGVRVILPGFEPDDDAFGVEPGHPSTVRLRPLASAGSLRPSAGWLTALNLAGRVPLPLEAAS